MSSTVQPGQEDFKQQLRAVFIERRKSLGLSQREVAVRMGTVQSALSDLEHGVTAAPNVDTLLRWSQALRIQLTIRLDFEQVTIAARTQSLSVAAPHEHHEPDTAPQSATGTAPAPG